MKQPKFEVQQLNSDGKAVIIEGTNSRSTAVNRFDRELALLRNAHSGDTECQIRVVDVLYAYKHVPKRKEQGSNG